nr:HDOD domain-containing protein [Nitrosopumilaceae archaeon]NIU86820.1 HDOD domain-containing protein [Nitrosopumilaceae archaeon]NIV65479.1 HDOD domain-containing protein [Nitrosopumilaceae archaeon]NIX62430.1 HDOD domain-containing protein [Nitrosopumilaceae archaeon]
LKDVALSIAFYSFYKDLKNGDNFDFQHLWRHSLMTALVGKALAKKYDPDHQDLFYIGGLLHDIGKLVESIVIAKDYQLLQKKSREEGLRLDQVERRNLKFHHGDVGGLLVEKWNLPEILVNMIRYHHYPDEFIGEPTYYRQIRFVYLSNILTHYIQDEFEGLEAILNFDLNFSNYFSFSGDEFEELITEIKEDMEKKQQLFKIN